MGNGNSNHCANGRLRSTSASASVTGSPLFARKLINSTGNFPQLRFSCPTQRTQSCDEESPHVSSPVPARAGRTRTVLHILNAGSPEKSPPLRRTPIPGLVSGSLDSVTACRVIDRKRADAAYIVLPKVSSPPGRKRSSSAPGRPCLPVDTSPHNSDDEVYPPASCDEERNCHSLDDDYLRQSNEDPFDCVVWAGSMSMSPEAELADALEKRLNMSAGNTFDRPSRSDKSTICFTATPTTRESSEEDMDRSKSPASGWEPVRNKVRFHDANETRLYSPLDAPVDVHKMWE